MLDPKITTQLQAIVAAQPCPIAFATLSGSHIYGFPSPDSDYDLRGVHILPIETIVGLTPGKETIETSKKFPGLELDLVTHELQKFMGLMLKKNGYVLEQLLSPIVLYTTSIHEELCAIAPACITRHHSHHYLGFAQTEWRLFSKQNPLRVKPLLYVYRVLLTGIHLMQTGEIEPNLIKLNQKFGLEKIDELISIKIAGAEKSETGTINLEFHQAAFIRLLAELEKERDRSHLPTDPTAKPALNDLLLRVRLNP
ncbi:MAG: nucleotidyltransferase domain-containing protein [Alkalinema sp. FL-bin-369]|nr:nucleotidyltransferase domain-containing protein [Leptolyngbyaceae cyanobacterium LF-bin-369]